MRLRNGLVVCLFLAVGTTWAVVSNPWLGKTMTSEQVKKRWGTSEFNEAKFKAGDMETKAKMTYSLMTGGKLKGLTVSEVRERLGDFSGHYFSESYPTYMIQEAKNSKEESWQIVFLIDKDRKTKDIIVHKNCCD